MGGRLWRFVQGASLYDVGLLIIGTLIVVMTVADLVIRWLTGGS